MSASRAGVRLLLGCVLLLGGATSACGPEADGDEAVAEEPSGDEPTAQAPEPGGFTNSNVSKQDRVLNR